ncbi:MAG: aminotransferase class I/II-fold pyridoxal phosphate-dependent enzyme [Chitinophagaceae bacterium]|nr:aminotransferase class I/II-fold pyridoxal phosphate-dependent enzyme [Chitinophagaceae bacterium]
MSTVKLSHLAETLHGSEIVRLGATIKELIRQGNHIYNFTIGDFDSAIFPIPAELEEEIISAYQNGYTTYPAAEGILELRNAVSAFIASRQGLHYGPSEILIAAGGRPLIYSLYRAIVDKGDKVIYPAPSWNNNHYVHFTEGQHVTIEAGHENNFMLTAEQIKPHISGASLISLCSPLNPTGTTFSKDELGAICDLILEENGKRAEGAKKLYLMYDQIYWTLTFGDTVHYDPVSLRPAMRDYTIFIDGISKAFAATGVRVGWALGPSEVLAKMRSINSHVGAWAPMAEQKAVSNYLLRTDEIDRYFLRFKSEVHERLQRISDGFLQLKKEGFAVDAIAPQAAIYLTIQIDYAGKKTADGKLLASQADVTSYLLSEAKLAIVPFYAFGASTNSSWYRLSVGTCKKEEIDEMLGMLKAALQKLS